MEQKKDFGVFISGEEGQAMTSNRWSQTGFPDPDRGSPKHDLACQYLSQPDIATKLLTHVLKTAGCEIENINNCDATTEFHVRRVAYRSVSTIGFADLVIESEVKLAHQEYACNPLLLVEVKTARRPVGDILRQMKTYRDFMYQGRGYGIGPGHFSSFWMVLVVTYDLTVKEVEWLKREGVTHVRLAAAFDNFCRISQVEKASSVEM